MFPFGSAHVIEDLKNMGVPEDKIYVTEDYFVVISRYDELPEEIINKIKEKYVVGYMGYFLRDMVIVEEKGEDDV